MKKTVLYVLVAILLVSACSTSKTKLDKVEPSISKLNKDAIKLNDSKKTKDKKDKKAEEKKITSKDNKTTSKDNKISSKDNRTTSKDNKINSKDNRTTSKDNKTTSKDNKNKSNNTVTTSNKDDKKQSKEDKQKQKENKKKQKERQKAAEKQKKEAEKQKKENEKQKRKEDKEKKNKQKEQDDLIKKAKKEEKERIEAERKKEKEGLLQILNENKDNEDVEEEESVTTKASTKVDTMSTKASDTISLQELLTSGGTDVSSVVKDVKDEDNTPEFLKKAKKKTKEKQMTTMDKVVYMMDAKQQLQNSSDTALNQINPSLYYDTTKKENFIKRTWHKIFPKKVDRDITYKSLYEEEPKNILILYPWNRSTFDKSDEMLYIMTTKELGKKGYYVYSAITMMEKYKQDTTFCSQYIQLKDIKEIGRQYNADAVMFITIFRFENPYWSTATTANTHYTLISTKTLDTLFYRQVDFNYDTPIPPKEYHNSDLELDKEQVYGLGVMEQMQVFAFEDFPLGPYHKNYKKDKKRFSNKSEVKYKINVRPS